MRNINLYLFNCFFICVLRAVCSPSSLFACCTYHSRTHTDAGSNRQNLQQFAIPIRTNTNTKKSHELRTFLHFPALRMRSIRLA